MKSTQGNTAVNTSTWVELEEDFDIVIWSVFSDVDIYVQEYGLSGWGSSISISANDPYLYNTAVKKIRIKAQTITCTVKYSLIGFIAYRVDDSALTVDYLKKDGSNANQAVDLSDYRIEAVNTKITAWKSHREADQTFIANTWTDIVFDLKVTEECLDGCSYYDEGEVTEDTSIIVITGFNDIFCVGGCSHFYWTGSSGASCSVFSRVLFSSDLGSTWSEASCLQTNSVESRGLNAEGTQGFSGSIKVDGTIWIKLQVRVSNADMELRGDLIFDNPVAATLHLSNLGNNNIVS